MRAAPALIAVALLAAGCDQADESRFGLLRVTEVTQSTWRYARRPPSSGPAVGVEAVAFLDEQHGFLVSGPGIGADGRPPAGFGRVQETRDGGTTWRTLWSERGVFLHALAFSDPLHGVVAGARHGQRPLLLRTSDGARSWAVLSPRLPRRAWESWPAVFLEFPSPLVGYAIRDQHFDAYGLHWVLRTTDGGRTWRELPAPQDVTSAYAVDFLDARHGFVAGSAKGCDGVWRTDDAGATWRLLRASCGRVRSVDFLDERTGFVAGGNPYYAEAPPWQVVRGTTDGGRTWRTLFVDPRRRNRGTNPIVELHFTGRRVGFGATGGCKGGQNSPCGGLLLATTDGGRHWRDTGVDAMDVAAVGSSAWAVPPCLECGVLWRTRDAGRTWTALAGPGRAQLERIDASGSRLVLVSDAGVFSSGDGARSWRREPGRWYEFADWPRRHLSHPPVDPWAVAFADPRRGYLAGDPIGRSGLFATDDGGRTWRRLRPPFRVDTISPAPGLVALSDWSNTGPRRVAFSRDGGRTWLVRTFPRRAWCEPTAGAQSTVWLGCELDAPRFRRVLLRSDDAGRTWTKLGVIPPAVERVVGTATDAWAVGGGLWHSRDGGRTWTERWPRLPTPPRR